MRPYPLRCVILYLEKKWWYLVTKLLIFCRLSYNLTILWIYIFCKLTKVMLTPMKYVWTNEMSPTKLVEFGKWFDSCWLMKIICVSSISCIQLNLQLNFQNYDKAVFWYNHHAYDTKFSRVFFRLKFRNFCWWLNSFSGWRFLLKLQVLGKVQIRIIKYEYLSCNCFELNSFI